VAAEKTGRGKAADPGLPVWARERPQRRPALSRDVIVNTAIKIADAEGIDAVSIRRVAGDLGVRPMSLYTYIDRKEDLLALMRDQVSGEILIGRDLPHGWREALAAIARRTRNAVLRHPWMIDTPAHGAALGPNALRHVEESITALEELDLSPQVTIEILTAVDKFVLGHVIFEIGSRSGDISGLAQPYIDSLLASGEFPALSRIAADARAATATEDEFERGLSWLLDGIAANISNGHQ
jgi:AcrR family transcriptional regulator